MGLFGAMFLAGGALFFWVAGWGVLDNRPLRDGDLRRYGRPAVATVLQVGAPGEDGHAEVALRVQPRNESSFKATARLNLGSTVQPVGGEVRVKFDPNKRKHLIVVS